MPPSTAHACPVMDRNGCHPGYTEAKWTRERVCDAIPAWHEPPRRTAVVA
jgi:hypothetical protein